MFDAWIFKKENKASTNLRHMNKREKLSLRIKWSEGENIYFVSRKENRKHLKKKLLNNPVKVY